MSVVSGGWCESMSSREEVRQVSMLAEPVPFIYYAPGPTEPHDALMLPMALVALADTTCWIRALGLRPSKVASGLETKVVFVSLSIAGHSEAPQSRNRGDHSRVAVHSTIGVATKGGVSTVGW